MAVFEFSIDFKPAQRVLFYFCGSPYRWGLATGMESGSSDEVMRLPAVPRVRRGTPTNASAARNERPVAKGRKRDLRFSAKRKQRESPRRHSKRRRNVVNVHSDDDENEEDESDHPPARRTKRVKRRMLQSRRILDEDEDEDDDEDDHTNGNSGENERDDEDDEGRDGDDSGDKYFGSKSNSRSSTPVKMKRGSGKENSSESKDDEGDGTVEYAEGDDSDGMPDGGNLFAQLEEENYSEEDKSDESEVEKVEKKSGERLTSRQRAMQGESVELEFSKLDSPKSKKKKEPTEEWDHDEEMELKKQQKARLRQMIHEKRNKEKRAAMVDKVLRGVTSKRKKITMASEARAAKVGSRLIQNEVREGCIRFVSNVNGMSVSLPKDVNAPIHLEKSVKAVYPPACKRDPKTGKRILA